MRILIADRNAEVRRGLREILNDALPEASIFEAGSGDDIFHHLAGAEFAFLVLDMDMPDRSGLEVLQDVKSQYPQLPVIMVCAQSEEHYVACSLHAGAAAFINKDSAPEELAQAARKMMVTNTPS